MSSIKGGSDLTSMRCFIFLFFVLLEPQQSYGQPICYPDKYEINNSKEQATDIELSTTYTDLNLCSAVAEVEDIDIFSFHLTKRSRILAKALFESDAGRLKVNLLDSGFGEIVQSVGGGSPQAVGQTLDPGVYYLVVYHFTPGSFSGKYSIRLQTQDHQSSHSVGLVSTLIVGGVLLLTVVAVTIALKNRRRRLRNEEERDLLDSELSTIPYTTYQL